MATARCKTNDKHTVYTCTHAGQAPVPKVLVHSKNLDQFGLYLLIDFCYISASGTSIFCDTLIWIELSLTHNNMSKIVEFSVTLKKVCMSFQCITVTTVQSIQKTFQCDLQVVPFKHVPSLCVLSYNCSECSCQYAGCSCNIQLVCKLWDNDRRALMSRKAESHKSLHMKEIWPLHPLESWPWILVLHLAARIRGNLPQTHILLQEIWVYFASALFQKCKTRLLLNCNLWLLTERESTVQGVDFSLPIFFLCQK